MECSPTLLPSDDETVSPRLRAREGTVKLLFRGGLVTFADAHYIPSAIALRPQTPDLNLWINQ